MNDNAQPGTNFHINCNDQLRDSTHDKHNLNLYDRGKNREIKN